MVAFQSRPPGAFTSAAKEPTKLGQGAEPWSWLGAAHARRRRRAATARPSCVWPPSAFVQSLPNSLSLTLVARVPSTLPPKSPLGRRTHGCGRGAVGEPSVSAGFCNRRHRMNAIRGVGACVISVRCQLRLAHLLNRSMRLSKACKSALQWSHEPDTISKTEPTPFQAEQMPLVCRGALGRPRPPCC